MTDSISGDIGGAHKDELKEYIRNLMPIIDGDLSLREIPLSQRSFRAGITIVEEFVIEVSGDDNKDDFATKPWFAIIYHHINQWYRDHYGPLLDQNPSGFARGVVSIRNIPIEMKVPLTRSRVEIPGETAWLYFPVDVDSTEDPLAWFVNALPFNSLQDSELNDVRNAAIELACALRSIRQFTTGVVDGSDIIRRLLEGILPEMESAATQILRNDRNSVGTAFWAVQIGCERALKAFCQQQTNTFRETHDLFVLFDDAIPHGLIADRNLLKSIPRCSDLVDSRYGLGESRSVQNAMGAYRAGAFACKCCHKVT
jgi:hypothetical protein